MLTVSTYTHQRVNHNIPIRIPRIWNSLQDRIWGRFSSKSLAKWTGRGMTPVPSKVRGQCAGGFELSSTTKIVPFCCSTQQLTYSYVEKSELVYCMKNMQIVTCWMRRHQLPHGGAKELPLHPTSHFGDLKPKGSVWLKAQFQSIQTQRKSHKGSQHKGSQIARFIIACRSGVGGCWQHNEPGEGQSSNSGHKPEGDREQGSKYLLLIRFLGQCSLSFCRLSFKCGCFKA